MFEIAVTVASCLRAGTRVDVAWAVETHGFSSRDRGEALALTPGGGRVGRVLSGSLNDQLAELATEGVAGRLLTLHVGDLDAMAAGLACGGDARALMIPATDLPAELWPRLLDREPVCLVTELDGDRAVATRMFTRETIGDTTEETAQRFQRGISDTVVTPEAVVTVLWPVPRLMIVGAGAIADAVASAADLLGWHIQTTADLNTATATIAGLSGLDKLLVISHDLELAGPALAAALSCEAGYIGALGSRGTQQARAEWLADRGVTGVGRIHGPAGLDIGASSPAEIAVSILAEALATGSGSTAGSLRERSGSIHQSGPSS